MSNIFFVHVTCGCGSVLLHQQCSTLCTSSFVDDIMFAHNELYGMWLIGCVLIVTYQGQNRFDTAASSPMAHAQVTHQGAAPR